MADQPCSNCQHYDPIIRGTEEGRHGRCADRSTYPAKEQPGQVFPVGVRREPPGELAKPVIVVGSDVMVNCAQFRGKPGKRGKS